MRTLLALPLIVAFVVAYPYSGEETKTIMNMDSYSDNLVIYEGSHDIFDIIVKPSDVSADDDSENKDLEILLNTDNIVYFVEADIKDDRRENHSVYSYKNGKVSKIMDKGRAIAVSADSNYVFIGTEDGIYVYDPETQKANKYGNFDNSVKNMAKEQNDDIIYILTDDRELYKVFDAATKKLKVEDVKDAEQIILDNSNNLYYFDKDNNLYVRTKDGMAKKIENLPEGAKEVSMFRPPLFGSEGVILLVDNGLYVIFPDGRSEPTNLGFTPEAKPTAFSVEAGFTFYFGYKKKIYQYDIKSIIKSYLNEFDASNES